MVSMAERLGVVGNCQAELVHAAVAAATGAAGFYHAFDRAADATAAAELASCELLLVQDIRECDDYRRRMAIPAATRIVDFPCLRFSSPWPFDDFNGWRDGVARAQDGGTPALYYDGALGRLRRLGVAPAARLAAYRALSIPGVLDPLRLHDFEARRLEAQDARFGTSIGSTILAEFRSRQLFYAVTRPAGPLIAKLLDFVFDALGVSARPPATFDLDMLRDVQIPVHPVVADKLALSWPVEAAWESYVAAYIARYG